MSQGEFDKRWMAYLDGQLSAGEASAFDESLDAAARERIEAELQFEQALDEKLSDCPGCPVELWEKTLRQLNGAAAAPKRRSFQRQLVVLTLAASLVMSLGLGMAYVSGATLGGGAGAAGSPVRMARLGISETCISDFALRAQTPSSKAAIEQYLEEHNIRLALVEDEDSPVALGHRVRLLGSCMGNCPKGEIVEVLFDWDGQPAKIVMAPANSSGAKLIRAEEERGTVVRTKVLGDYIAGVVFSGKKAEETGMLLDLIRVKNERVAKLQQRVNQALSSTV
jgi:hypothetical protein